MKTDKKTLHNLCVSFRYKNKSMEDDWIESVRAGKKRRYEVAGLLKNHIRFLNYTFGWEIDPTDLDEIVDQYFRSILGDGKPV